MKPQMVDRASLPDAITVLVVTATTVEKKALLERLEPSKQAQAIQTTLVNGSVYYIGSIGCTDVVFLPGNASSGGRDGSGLNTHDAICEWGSKIVVMPGIAFGRDDEDGDKQMIGDVLVSSAIFPYTELRIGERKVVKRGGAPQASRGLFNVATNLGWEWTPKGQDEARGVLAGPLLSGPILVDNLMLKSMLFDEWPDAIGGEMEGHGVQAAADRESAQWLLCKAICDWGVGKGKDKKARQALAANNSMDFLQTLLAVAGLAANLVPRGSQRVGLSPMAAIQHAIREANDRTAAQSAVLGRMLAAAPKTDDGEIDLGVQKPIMEMEKAAVHSAVEAELNAYNDACLLVLDGQVDESAFARMFGGEIVELVTMSGFQRPRLHPRGESAFLGIWEFYDRISAE